MQNSLLPIVSAISESRFLIFVLLVLLYGTLHLSISAIVNFTFRVYNRFLRFINIQRFGYPPPHCDGDGDLKYYVQKKLLFDSKPPGQLSLQFMRNGSDGISEALKILKDAGFEVSGFSIPKQAWYGEESVRDAANFLCNQWNYSSTN